MDANCIIFPGTSAALGVIFAQQASELLGMSPNNMANVLPIAIGVILFLALLNIIGSSLGGKVQTVATIGKMIPLILIIVFGFIKGQSSEVLNPFVGDGVNASNALGQVLIATLFAYDGWINVGAISGEMKSPEKDLPRAIVGGLSLVMAVYIIINIAYLWVVPASELATVTSPATLVATRLFGNIGGKVITVGILISVFGTLNGYLLTGSRIPYTLAEMGTLPASKTLLSSVYL
ncbi:amino acid permease family protein [Clostridioides difficile DA00165]|nr:amino acid permease family protein [Clostridioides difficile DA00165]